MTECDRCGEYCYHPVRIAALNVADMEKVRDIVMLMDGFDHITYLCRKCARDFDDFLANE